MQNMNKYLHPISRALVALIFIVSGIGKIANFQATAALMGNVGFPAPTLFLISAIVFELLGGLALLLGFKARWAALALIIFLVPATLIFHVAHLNDPAQAQQQLIHVLKNLAILGGLLKFVADGPGALAIDKADEPSAVVDRRERIA